MKEEKCDHDFSTIAKTFLPHSNAMWMACSKCGIRQNDVVFAHSFPELKDIPEIEDTLKDK